MKSTIKPGDELTAHFSAKQMSIAINPRYSKKQHSIAESYRLFGVFMSDRSTVERHKKIENPEAAFAGRFEVTFK